MRTTTGSILTAAALSIFLAFATACSHSEMTSETNGAAAPTDNQTQTGQTSGQNKNASADETRTAAQTQKDDKTLIVLTDSAYAPYEYTDANGGSIGFDIDLINAIAKDRGMKTRILNHNFQDLFEILDNSEEADLIIACLSKTPQRAKLALLSDNYLDVRTSVAVKKGSSIRTFDDLKNKRIAYIGESVFQNMLDDSFGENYEAIPTKSNYLALREVMIEQADAAMMDDGVMRHYIKSNGMQGLKLLPPSDKLPAKETVIAVKKSKPEVLELVNTGLRNIQNNGEYDRIRKKWLSN